jgi:hypothetical protein
VLAYSRALRYDEFVARTQETPGGNARRRLLNIRYDETRLGPAIQFAAATFPETLHMLALVSEEDPDTLAVLPIVARLANGGPRLELRVLCDEDDLTPLTVLAPDLDPAIILEEWDLPQFLCFDEDWYLQAQWGPRPAAAEAQVEGWLAAHPEYELLAEDETPEGHDRYVALVEQLVYEMRVWYNSGLTARGLDEWLEILRAWQADDAAGPEGSE